MFRRIALSCAVLCAVLALACRPRPFVAVEVKSGERMQEFVARLEREKLLTRADVEGFAAVFPSARCPGLPPPAAKIERFEGMLRPGTYRFRVKRHAGPAAERTAGNARAILSRIIAASRGRCYASRLEGLELYQQFVLASIVEKEAAAGKDHDKVASVFLNRLRSNCRLCSCPALEYALGYHRPFLTMQDLALDSPYNLYRRRGLPPTPICFFSDGALRAVRNPARTRLFFFVFDWTRGELLFAEQWKEHLKNARTARENYLRRHGRDKIHRIYPGRFYEPMPPG